MRKRVVAVAASFMMLANNGPRLRNSYALSRRSQRMTARVREAALLAAGQTILNDTGKLNARPATRARNLVDGVHADTAASSWQARQKICAHNLR
jgi:hypothetical protein